MYLEEQVYRSGIMDQQLNNGVTEGLANFTAKYELDAEIISDLREMLLTALHAHVKSTAAAATKSPGKAAKSADKRPRRKTGYNLYIQAKFSEAKGVEAGVDGKTNSQELMSAFSKEWKALSDEDKKPYLDQAEELNGSASASASASDTEGEPAAAAATTPAAKSTPAAKKATTAATATTTPAAKAPAKSAGKKTVSGYNLFYSENKDVIKAALAEGETLMKVVGAKWTALGDVEKDDYKKRAAELTAASP